MQKLGERSVGCVTVYTPHEMNCSAKGYWPS